MVFNFVVTQKLFVGIVSFNTLYFYCKLCVLLPQKGTLSC